jgi:hypothetical protein
MNWKYRYDAGKKPSEFWYGNLLEHKHWKSREKERVTYKLILDM